MELAHAAGCDGEQRAGHRRGDGKLNLRGDAHLTGGERLRRLRQKPVAMGERRRVQRAGSWIFRQWRRHRTFSDIDFMVGEVREGGDRHAEILGEYLMRRVPEPIGDRERAELGEVAVVEHEDEGAAAFETLDRMAVAARKVPHIARPKVDDLRLVLRIDRGDACAALDHISPLGSIGVPVQLAHRAGLERHVDPGELVGHRELHDGRLLGGAAIELLGRCRAKRVAEGGKLRSRERRGRRPVGRLHGFAHDYDP
jgi:hypothetical protein